MLARPRLAFYRVVGTFSAGRCTLRSGSPTARSAGRRPSIRPGARYFHSLRLLDEVKRLDPTIFTKSGVMVGLANWPGKEQEALSKRFVERTGEPWFGHDSIFGYAHTMVLKQALEDAGSADRVKVAEALRKMDMTTGPARLFPGGRLKFDENGRRVGAELVVVQWQNGKPVTVFPKEVAAADAIWGKG